MESAKISWVHFNANVQMEHMKVHPQKMVVLLQKKKIVGSRPQQQPDSYGITNHG